MLISLNNCNLFFNAYYRNSMFLKIIFQNLNQKEYSDLKSNLLYHSN